MVTPASTPSSPLGNQDYRDQAEFRHAIRRFSRFSEQQARARNIPPQQHLLLLMVRGHSSYPCVSIGDLANQLQLRPHSASLLVARGVKRGLLIRTDDTSDRRRVLVSLTDVGQRLLEEITLANRQELQRLGGALFRDSFMHALRVRNEETANGDQPKSSL